MKKVGAKVILSFVVGVFLYSSQTFGQSTLELLSETTCFEDRRAKLIICQISKSRLEMFDKNTYTEIVTKEANYIFETPSQLSHKKSYKVTNKEGSPQLFFTDLPVISIRSSEEIEDEPKVPGTLEYTSLTEGILEEFINIELRGGSTLTNDKKNYDFSVKDGLDGESKNVTFSNLRVDDDWILDGMSNEPLMIRSKTAHQLWLAMHDPGFLSSDAKYGVDVRYVEVFVNNNYRGVYMLSEKVDRKLLDLDKKEDEKIEGQLYKGIAWDDNLLFKDVSGYSNKDERWGGFDFKYPKDCIEWSYLHDFIEFAIFSNNSDFENNIADRFHLSSLIDYYIFLNLLSMPDNTGKNIYIAAKELDAPYFYIPWDLDGVYGLIWDSSKDGNPEKLLANGLYDRLLLLNPNSFRKRLQDRWFELRSGILQEVRLFDDLNMNHLSLTSINLYEREAYIYNSPPDQERELSFINTWLPARLAFLDRYFTDINTSSFIPQRSFLTLSPNPVSDQLSIELANETKAEVVIYNMEGRIVHVQELTSRISILDLKHLTENMYVVRVNDQTELIIKL